MPLLFSMPNLVATCQLHLILSSQPQLQHAIKNNDDLAWDLVNLLAPLQVFMSKMEEQKEAQRMNTVSTRGASQDPPFLQCVKNVIVMFKSVDKMVVDENVGGLIAQFKPLTLTRAQQARMWDQSRHDVLDPRHRLCTRP
jgi:hypothetical protein